MDEERITIQEDVKIQKEDVLILVNDEIMKKEKLVMDQISPKASILMDSSLVPHFIETTKIQLQAQIKEIMQI